MRLFDCCSLSGGAQNGAYQAGVLLALWDVLNERGVSHEQITEKLKVWLGVSVGAINGAFMAQGEHPDNLCKMWLRTRTHNVISKFFFGPIQGYWAGGMYKTVPLGELLKENIDPQRIADRGAKFLAGSVSLKTAEYDAPVDNGPLFYKHILASAAHPIAMVPEDVGGDLRTDGGIRHVNPLRDAIRVGGSYALVVNASPGKLKEWHIKEPTIWERSLREFDIMMDEAHKDDLRMTDMINMLVEAEHPVVKEKGWRRVDYEEVRPEEALESDFLEFTEEQADRLITRGVEDGRAKFASMEF